MSASQEDALARAVAEHGPFPMPVGTTDEVARSQGMHADSKACGTCKALARDGKPIEHEQCAARAVLLLPPDQPVYEDLVDLTDEQRKALPARFHTPVFDGLGQPNAWLCQVCWGDGWVSQWPCGPAQEKGATVFVSEGAAEDVAAELVRLRAERAQLQDDITGACLARYEEEQENARLRARVAELEAARTTAAADRDKQIIAWLEQKAAEYGTSNRERRAKAEAVNRMADKLSRGAVRPACPPVSPEDPHDGPLSHRYELGRDLPEVTPEPPEVTVDRWNAQYPVGTPVTAHPGFRPETDPKGTQLITRTRSAASVLSGHTAVVWVEGHSSCIKLTHVYPRHESDGAL
ncbi:hypothetical protein [Streptomyces cyaneofuscatus]|uniref:hypothetical protein n=1 Tax=Streptomyces cyaneofuscatus TaxID=66883 RepID=UPI00332991C9